MSPAWNPSVGQSGETFAGLNNSTVLKAVLKNASASKSHAAAGVVRGAPLLGEGRRLYLASYDGTVQARSQTAPDEVAWSVTNLGPIESSPTIDCTRDVSSATPIAGAPGVLYVGTNTGKLYAFVVDSRGIDTTASWPKYQHDPRNTGNPETALSEFACH